MSDVDGGAAAPAESTSAPEAVQTPNPVSTENTGHPPAEKPEAKAEPKAEKKDAKPVSTREALQKAAAKVEKDNAPKPDTKEVKTTEKAGDKAEAKPEVKADNRNEKGQFAPKEGDKAQQAKAADTKPQPSKASFTDDEPPARFSPGAKAKWFDADPEVRGETQRAIRELTEGHAKYKAAAERDAGLNEFHEMAKQSGKELRQVVGEYVNMENHLRKDLVGGLDLICSRMGVSLKDVAAHILGKTPDQNASQQDALIRELRNEISTLKQQVGGVTQTIQQQREASTLQEVTKFAQEHPRFEELSDDIAFFMKSGRAKDLSEAYELAERLNPAPAKPPKPAASSAPAIDLSVQTEKGQKSIQGSPTPGSDPVRRQPSTSIKESLRRAAAAAG